MKRDEALAETFVRSEQVYDGSLLKVYRDTVTLPDGRAASREIIRHPGAAAVVPVLPDGKIALVRQYRYPLGKITLEIPAGKLDRGEPPEACAKRELREETGYTANRLIPLASVCTTPGFTDEIIHLYLAEDLTRGAQRPDEDEFIHVEPYSPAAILALMRTGGLSDAKSMLGLLLALKQMNMG